MMHKFLNLPLRITLFSWNSGSENKFVAVKTNCEAQRRNVHHFLAPRVFLGRDDG